MEGFFLYLTMILKEYRYIRYLLWERGIKFYNIDDEFIFMFRNRITKVVTEKNDRCSYILDFGLKSQEILNTEDEYESYMKANS